MEGQNDLPKVTQQLVAGLGAGWRSPSPAPLARA